MNNTIKINSVPVTVDYCSLNMGDMYLLPCGGTYVYMVLPKTGRPGYNGVSVNLRTGSTYYLQDHKRVVPISKGSSISIVAGGDDSDFRVA